MKTPNLIITVAQLVLFVYLLVIQILHHGWNKTEKVLFWAGLFVAIVNSVVVLVQRKKTADQNISDES